MLTGVPKLGSATYITCTPDKPGFLPTSPGTGGAIDTRGQNFEAAVQRPETTQAGAVKRRPASGNLECLQQ